MPKLKTHRGAAKRFKRTGTGKLMRRHAYHCHILSKKTRKRKRHLRTAVVVSPADAKVLERMLPYGMAEEGDMRVKAWTNRKDRRKKILKLAEGLLRHASPRPTGSPSCRWRSSLAVRLSRPPAAQARVALAVDRPHQRGGPCSTTSRYSPAHRRVSRRRATRSTARILADLAVRDPRGVRRGGPASPSWGSPRSPRRRQSGRSRAASA